MRIDMSMTGGEELIRKLNQLPTALSRKVQIQALTKGAEPIRASAESLAPRDEAAGAPHMADHIIIRPVSARALDAAGLFDQAAVEVGPAAPFFYGFFQEIGTAFHPAQAFMRPAFDSMVRRAQTIVGQEAWAAIRRHLGLGGGASSSRGTL